MLTLQYIPHTELQNLQSEDKIRKLLNLVKSDRILLVEGRLKPSEETALIERTMEMIDRKFKGIEIGTIYTEKKNIQPYELLKKQFLQFLGYREGITIIGPASIVKEIKRDPNKIELLTRDSKKRKK